MGFPRAGSNPARSDTFSLQFSISTFFNIIIKISFIEEKQKLTSFFMCTIRLTSLRTRETSQNAACITAPVSSLQRRTYCETMLATWICIVLAIFAVSDAQKEKPPESKLLAILTFSRYCLFCTRQTPTAVLCGAPPQTASLATVR